MNKGDTITVPVFRGTKGGGRRVVGFTQGQVIFAGPKFITVKVGKYTETFTYSDLNAKEGKMLK